MTQTRIEEKSEMIQEDTSKIGDRFAWEFERGLDLYLLDQEDKIEASRDKCKYFLERRNDSYGEWWHIWNDKLVREISMLKEMILDTDKSYQELRELEEDEEVLDRIDEDQQLLDILRNHMQCIKENKIKLTPDTKAFYKKIFDEWVDKQDVRVEIKLRISAGAAWCLALLTGHPSWAREARSITRRIHSYVGAKTTRKMAEDEYNESLVERSWLNSDEIIEAIDHRAQVRKITTKHKVSFKEALMSTLNISLDQLVAIDKRLDNLGVQTELAYLDR